MKMPHERRRSLRCAVLFIVWHHCLRVAGAGITIEIGSGRRRALAAKRQKEAKEEERRRREVGQENSADYHVGTSQESKHSEEVPPESWPPFVTRGWLWKKGHIRHNWKRRYFVLNEDWSELKYFSGVSSGTEQPIGEPLGKLVLAGATASLGLDYVPKRAHVFSMTVRTKDEIYYCEAASEEERQRWLRTINTAGAARKTVWDSWSHQSSAIATEEAATHNSQDYQQLSAQSQQIHNSDLPLARRRPSLQAPHYHSMHRSRQQESRRYGLMTAFERPCVDAMVDDLVSYHKSKAIARTVKLLNSEHTLGKMNRALRGAYVVESIELKVADPIAGVRVLSAALAKSPSAVASRLERKFRPGTADACVHRLSVDFEWPQRLHCTVRGIRPKGGGLPPFLRAVIPKNLLLGRHAISFSLASRLEGASGLALDLVSSSDAPWPKLRRVTVAKLPRLHLELVEDDRGLLGFVFSFMPQEVIVSLLENAVNDAIAKPGRKLAWDVIADPSKVQSTKHNRGRPQTSDHHSSSATEEHTNSESWLHRPMSTSTVDALRSVAAIAAQAARAAARDSALAAASVKQAAESLRSAVLDPTTFAQIENRQHNDQDIIIDSHPSDHQLRAQYVDDEGYVEDMIEEEDEEEDEEERDEEDEQNLFQNRRQFTNHDITTGVFEEDDDDDDDELLADRINEAASSKPMIIDSMEHHKIQQPTSASYEKADDQVADELEEGDADLSHEEGDSKQAQYPHAPPVEKADEEEIKDMVNIKEEE